MNITYKTAVPQDSETIANLANEIWSAHYTPIIGSEQVRYMLDDYQSAATICEQITNGTIYTIAYSNDIPIAYSAYKKETPKIFLSKVYVKDAFRGHGIAKTFLHIAENAATGEKSIYLTVNKKNSHAIEAYKQMGFSVVDRVVSDIGHGFVMDDFIMEKDL